MNILDEIVNEFKNDEDIKAIALGGSSASGYDDEISDYDLYFYVKNSINPEKRFKIAEKFAEKYEIDNNFFENGDEWILKDSGKGIDLAPLSGIQHALFIILKIPKSYMMRTAGTKICKTGLTVNIPNSLQKILSRKIFRFYTAKWRRLLRIKFCLP